MSWKVGDVVTASTGNNYVYELIDDDDKPFYVGITNNPATRLRGHMCSDVPAVRAAVAACWLPRLLIVAGPMCRADAEAEELRRILAAPELLNRAQRGRLRERDPEARRAYWRRKKQRQRARRRSSPPAGA